MKFTKKEINTLLKNRENHVSELINAIIYYEEKDEDDYANHIVWRLLEIVTEDLVQFLIDDLIKRDHYISSSLMYTSIWTTLCNSQQTQDIVFDVLQKQDKKVLNQVLYVLSHFIEDKSNIGQQNIDILVNRLKNEKI